MSPCHHAELLRQLAHERWRVSFAKRGRKWVAFCPGGHWVEVVHAGPQRERPAGAGRDEERER